MILPQIQAGDIGTTLNFSFVDENGNPISVTGTTPTLTIISPDNTRTAGIALAITDGGLEATYTLTGTDFQNPGLYSLQPIYSGGPYGTKHGPVYPFEVLPNA